MLRKLFSIGTALLVVSTIGWLGVLVGLTVVIADGVNGAGGIIALLSALWAIGLACWIGTNASIVNEFF